MLLYLFNFFIYDDKNLKDSIKFMIFITGIYLEAIALIHLIYFKLFLLFKIIQFMKFIYYRINAIGQDYFFFSLPRRYAQNKFLYHQLTDIINNYYHVSKENMK